MGTRIKSLMRFYKAQRRCLEGEKVVLDKETEQGHPTRKNLIGAG
jgi:hypothetical protein